MGGRLDGGPGGRLCDGSGKPAPTLVVGIGNPSRGDDALGPLLAQAIADRAALHPEWGAVEVLIDFQLQIEYVLDLAGRARVVFVDAAASGPDGFQFGPVHPAAGHAITSHALAPDALLAVYCRHHRQAPPPCHLLAVRGHGFELGADLSPPARRNLHAACDMLSAWLGKRPAGFAAAAL